MAKKTGITVVGVPKAVRYLRNKSSEITKNVFDGVTRATLFMEGEVKQSISGHRAEPTSVDTGRFMGSITSKFSKDSGVVSTLVKYAPHLEYGTSRMAPRYHFRNSLERNRKKIRAIIAKRIK